MPGIARYTSPTAKKFKVRSTVHRFSKNHLHWRNKLNLNLQLSRGLAHANIYAAIVAGLNGGS